MQSNRDLIPNARSLRKSMTKEERRLWYGFLRDYPVHIYKQRVIGNYIVDFFCMQASLVIELDGSQHCEPAAQSYDAARTDRKSTRLNSSHSGESRMPSSA